MALTSRVDQKQWWMAVEVLVIVVLVVWWSAGYLRVDAALDEMSDFGRSATFAIYETNSNVWLGYALGLGGIAALALRRLAPSTSFLACAVLSAVCGWWFSYLANESFALEAAVVAAAFATVWTTGHWYVAAVAGAASLLIGNYRDFAISKQLEVVNVDVSETIGPLGRLVIMLALLAASVAAAHVLRRQGIAAQQIASVTDMDSP